jgi:hypothetical protein
MKQAPTDPLTAALSGLETARRAIAAEIAAYPAPISGCDAQFNHLLAQRQRIANALTALQTEVIIPTSRNP